MPGLHGSSSLVPLANQQVASMRRELEAQQVRAGEGRQNESVSHSSFRRIETSEQAVLSLPDLTPPRWDMLTVS